MPCIQKARKVQSQVLVFCLDPSITFQLRPLPRPVASLPQFPSPLLFPPFSFPFTDFYIYQRRVLVLFPYSSLSPLPEFTFELSCRIYLNRLSISPHPRLLNHVSSFFDCVSFLLSPSSSSSSS